MPIQSRIAVKLTVRLPPELLDQLKAAAEQRRSDPGGWGFSVNGAVVEAVQQWLGRAAVKTIGADAPTKGRDQQPVIVDEPDLSTLGQMPDLFRKKE